jgi:membrane-bound metal-dependent hydrolase YbcI (DUF457 family)
MPLPAGHLAIGFTAFKLYRKNGSDTSMWRMLFVVVLLSNLPDVDVLFGLLLEGNGNAFHRGPTHSLLFAFLAALFVSKAHRLYSQIPRIDFGLGLLLVLSHIAADWLFTSSPVSFFWPLEVHWSLGQSSWMDILNCVFLDALSDAGIISGCLIVLLANRLIANGMGSRIYGVIRGRFNPLSHS